MEQVWARIHHHLAKVAFPFRGKGALETTGRQSPACRFMASCVGFQQDKPEGSKIEMVQAKNMKNARKIESTKS